MNRTPVADVRSRWLVVFTPTLALALGSGVSLFAADFVPTRYDDPVPDGCLANDCSLREAVIAAIGGTNRVLLSAGTYQLSLVGTGDNQSLDGDLDVPGGELEIVGLGADLTRIDGVGIGEAILTGLSASLDLTLRGIRFQRSDGSGVVILDGQVLIVDCTIADSTDAGLLTSGGVDSVTVRRATFAANGSTGVDLKAAFFELENVTATQNGGAELAVVLTSGNPVSCNHCTLVHTFGAGDEVTVSTGTVTFSNSIVAGGCAFNNGGSIDSAGGNVESTGNSCQFDHATDQAGVTGGNLALGVLAANGGLTQTIAPATSSVANGAALDALCADEDQRGVARTTDCESGAVELTNAHVPTPLFLDGFEQGHAGAWSLSVP